MSFQGDVRGIGLAELLQGLARGRKEGVLTLSSKSGLRCVLGLDNGTLHLLPGNDEAVEGWRERVRNAWTDDPHFRVDYLRMAEIARADRLEILFCLLDGDGVHFRFDPGKIPTKISTPEDPDGESAGIYCDGMQVEVLLLEYARLTDELDSVPGSRSLHGDHVPVAIDPDSAEGTLEQFLGQCNGNSTICEIADRVGWPLRQCTSAVAQQVLAGTLRLADSQEVLSLALYELARKNFSRASSRLTSWCRDGEPGPVGEQEAEALSNEWLAGRLTAALHAMAPSDVRTLLRRMDHRMLNPAAAVVHWTEACRIYPTDRIGRFHRIICEYRDQSDEGLPDLRQLLDLVREFRDAGFPERTGPLLMIATRREPSQPGIQLEIGQGLVMAGFPIEAGPWIVAGATQMLELGSIDRAAVALRLLVEADPTNRECRQLLARARRSGKGLFKYRKQVVVSLAAVGIIALGAAVKVRSDQARYDKLEEVRALVGNPAAAWALLDQYFHGESTEEVARVRGLIVDQERGEDIRVRAEWSSRFAEAHTMCNGADLAAGLRLALELPKPPRLKHLTETWPESEVLYTAIADSILLDLEDLGPPLVGSASQAAGESEIRARIESVQTVAEGAEITEELDQLTVTLEGFETRIRGREEFRKTEIARAIEVKNQSEQNDLLLKAQGHAKSGDFARALREYRELLLLDTTGKIEKVLEEELQILREKHAAVTEARRLATAGDHEQAFEVLASKLDNPEEFMLPWTVESFPSGIEVSLDGGRVRKTPFVIETKVGDTTRMTLTLAGYDDVELEYEGTADRFVYMSRTPDRQWIGEGRVDALPVAVDEDHIIVDRKGHLVRVGPGGVILWENHIDTLSGIARAPVFLPRRPGFLLLVTDDGDAWMFDAEDGGARIEGAWKLKSPPVSGPYLTQNVVKVLLKDGRLATWKTRLKPRLTDDAVPTRLDDEYRFGAHSGLNVLRLAADLENRLDSKWNDWVVEADKDVFRVFRGDAPDEGYTVSRMGAFQYLAWEAPHSGLPEGRLWISDDGGIRAFVPLPR